VARDATARLYDVDDKTLAFERLNKTGKYDQGTITFYAKKGKLVDLSKLHESIWATRLSGGTRSGVVSLEVTAVGVVAPEEGKTVLKVTGSEKRFVLENDPGIKLDDGQRSPLEQLRSTEDASQTVRVTGTVVGWKGRWPAVLNKPPADPATIRVTHVEVIKE
jgi:hypothetical protein